MRNAQDNAAHTCSYSCDRPECIKAQRDELAAAAAQEETDEVININGRSGFETHWLAGLAKIGDLLYAAPVTAAPAGDDGKPMVLVSQEFKAQAEYDAQISSEASNLLRDNSLGLTGSLPAMVGELLKLASTPAAPGIDLDEYDAGVLSDFGGGDIGWWQDYIRAELARAHEFYQSQIDASHKGDDRLPVLERLGWIQDSPKDGSEARDALRVAYRHLDVDSLRVSHRNDLAIIESAMHPQAGDAEVQP